MPTFPVFVKSWQEPIVTRLSTQANGTLQSQAAAVAMKNALLAPPLNPCILRGCSDGGGSFSTTVDLIADTSDIVAATSGNHTWMWFQHPSGVQFVIDFISANVQTVTVAVSISAGFTGGSATARPTATDERADAARTWFSSGTVGNYQLLLNHTTDGKLSYAFIVIGGVICSQWMIGEAEASHDAWYNVSAGSPPRICSIEGAGSTSAGSNLNFFATYYAFDRIVAKVESGGGAGTMLLRTTMPVSRGQDMVTRYQDFPTAGGHWPFWGIGLACITAPRRGRHGRLVDMWRTNGNTPAGYIFRDPAGGPNALMNLGHGLAVRWPDDLSPKVF